MKIPITMKEIKVGGVPFYLTVASDEHGSPAAWLQRLDLAEDKSVRQLDLEALLIDFETFGDDQSALAKEIEKSLNKTRTEVLIEDYRLGAIEGVLDEIDQLARWAILGLHLAEAIEQASVRGVSQSYSKTLAQIDVAMQDYRDATGSRIDGALRPIPWLDETESPWCDEEWFKTARLVKP